MVVTGFVVVISGPSGVGKNTVIRELMNRMPGLALSISSTTRQPRAGEAHGREYFFLTEEEFSERVEKGLFLEWAHVHQHRYGTDASYVQELVDKGTVVILEIDVQGAESVRRKNLDAVYVFLTAPRFRDLEERLRKRCTEPEETITKRLAIAKEELREMDKFQHVVVNDKVENAVRHIVQIIESKKKEMST